MTVKVKDKIAVGILQFIVIFFCFGISANASQTTSTSNIKFLKPKCL